MNNILIPTNDKFVEEVAKAVGRERLFRDASELLKATLGINLEAVAELDHRFHSEFEELWESDDEEAVWTRESYKADALAAINKINLLLLTTEQ